jgi:uncharacterized membrane protein
MTIVIVLLLFIMSLLLINFGSWLRLKACGFSKKTIKLLMVIQSVFLTGCLIYYIIIPLYLQ